MKKLSISYLSDGHRLITDGDIWIICHPEDGEIVASSGDEETAHELFGDGEIYQAQLNTVLLTDDHLTPGLVDSIKNVWGEI